MGEGELSAVGVRIQPLSELQTTDQAVPSPVGRERVRVRVGLFQLRLLSVAIFAQNLSRVGAPSRARSHRGLKQIIITRVRQHYLQNAEAIVSGLPTMTGMTPERISQACELSSVFLLTPLP